MDQIETDQSMMTKVEKQSLDYSASTAHATSCTEALCYDVAGLPADHMSMIRWSRRSHECRLTSVHALTTANLVTVANTLDEPC
jgi:hypothetical protein